MHLVWGPLGAGPLRAFVRSYREHDAGTVHDLIVVFNGVSADQGAAREPLLAELEGIPHRLIELERPLLDLPAYAAALARLDHARACILNSHSRILAAGWLASLEQALAAPRVGLAGASGSWASMRSYALYRAHLPSAYREVWPDRAATAAAFAALEAERTGPEMPPAPLRLLFTARALLDMSRGFPSFPAPHIRTNAFIGARELLREAFAAGARRKVDTHRLESGRDGLTARLRSSGREAVVVDRAGSSYRVEEWPGSETFWQGRQRGLLVADNQTENYERGDAARRAVLSAYAWGARAEPG